MEETELTSAPTTPKCIRCEAGMHQWRAHQNYGSLVFGAYLLAVGYAVLHHHKLALYAPLMAPTWLAFWKFTELRLWKCPECGYFERMK